MAQRFWLSRPAAGFAQASVLLTAGAVTVAAVVLTVMPLPGGALLNALTVAAVIAADVALFAALWRRQWAQYTALIDERLARAERELTDAESMASVGRVAVGIAHEIGNPLTGIANYTHVLRAHQDGTAEAAAALDGIENEVGRIDRIVSSVLDYTRPQKGPPAVFDAAGTLRQAVELLSAQGVFRRVHVEATIDEHPLSLIGSAHEIEQVFVNLLLNAIDAIDSDGKVALYAGRLAPDTLLRAPSRRSGDAASASKERRINPRLAEWRARHRITEPCAKFVVADSGPGVTPPDADRIFEPFFTTKDATQGSGLGLAIVQRVVDSHDGVVWVQRSREGGAAFHMVLPLRALDSAAIPVS